MRLIKFFGDGAEEADSTILHLSGCVTDHTLCGDTLDFDEGTLGGYEIVNGSKVTCPVCVRIIKHCRSAKI